MTSSTSSGATPARSSAPLMATAPSSCAGSVAKAPLKEPTGVRAALAMTMSFTGISSDGPAPAVRRLQLVAALG